MAFDNQFHRTQQERLFSLTDVRQHPAVRQLRPSATIVNNANSNGQTYNESNVFQMPYLLFTIYTPIVAKVINHTTDTILHRVGNYCICALKYPSY
jgi:hypothetical protein